MSQQSLKDKTIKGTAWSAIDNVTQMGVSFLVSIVLARLLSPDDYGLIGIINICKAFLLILIFMIVKNTVVAIFLYQYIFLIPFIDIFGKTEILDFKSFYSC